MSSDRRPRTRGARRVSLPRGITGWLLTGVTVGLIGGVTGCGNNPEAEANADADGNAPVGRVINVEVKRLEPGEFSAAVRLTGTVEAENDAVVSAEESGSVRRFLVQKGARVRKGQAIVELDDSLLKAQVAEAEAAADLANERYERQRRLWIDERVGSELTYLSALHEAERADAALDVLRTRLARTTIAAPFDGVFDDHFIEVGEMAAPGTPIIRVISTNALKVVGGVPERYAGQVRQGTLARISFDVLPGTVLERPVAFVGATIEERSRTFTVEIPIDHPNVPIKPAMVANLELVTAVLSDVISVPQSAMARTEDGFQVFVAVEENGQWVARSRRIQTGPSRNNHAVVTSGLQAGDRLITLGQVDDGDFIHILTADRPAGSQRDVAGDVP